MPVELTRQLPPSAGYRCLYGQSMQLIGVFTAVALTVMLSMSAPARQPDAPSARAVRTIVHGVVGSGQAGGVQSDAWSLPVLAANLPKAQRVQLSRPVAATYMPAALSMQSLLPFTATYLPAAQSMQSSLLPVTATYLPAAQSMQSDASLLPSRSRTCQRHNKYRHHYPSRPRTYRPHSRCSRRPSCEDRGGATCNMKRPSRF